MLSEGKPGGIFESPVIDNPYAGGTTGEFPAGTGGDSTTRFARSYALNNDAGKNELGLEASPNDYWAIEKSIWPYVTSATNSGGGGSMTSLSGPANTIMIVPSRIPYPGVYGVEIIYDCGTGNQGAAYCGGVDPTKTRIGSVGNGLMNLGFFDGHAKAVKGKKAIADDMFGVFTTFHPQATGWISRQDILQRLNNFTYWR